MAMFNAHITFYTYFIHTKVNKFFQKSHFAVFINLINISKTTLLTSNKMFK